MVQRGIHCMQKEIVASYRSRMEMDRNTLLEVTQGILEQMTLGLQRPCDGDERHRLMMLPSFVDRFPSGEEEGEYFALDLGGTSLKVVWVKIGNRMVLDNDVREYPIPEECYNTDNGRLMMWVVESCLEMMRSHPVDRVVVGFCYSFACRQDNLDHGEQLLWTKRFRGTGLLGENVVQVLRDEFKKKGVDAIVPALLNDSVASLVGAQFITSHVKCAVILGTGTNCSYIEQTKNIHTLPDVYRKHGDSMVINTEWGDCKIPVGCTVEEDEWVDLASANPGHGLFEKLISGLYIGDVVRRILCRIARETGMYASKHSRLEESGSFDGAALSAIYHDTSPGLSTTASVFEKRFGIKNLDHIELLTAKEICEMVALRSARLCAAAMVAVLSREFENTPTGRIGIAVDGSAFTKFEGYRILVRRIIDDILGDTAKSDRLDIIIADGSSVTGAAITAAVESAYEE